MTRWTPEEDGKLRELAAEGLSAREIGRALKDRTEAAVSGRAAKLELALNSRNNQALRDHLSAGGWLVRDDVGGAVGVHWATASRSGLSFTTAICERFVALGFLRPTSDRPNVYRWEPPALA